MKKINSLAIIFLSLLLLNSCSTVAEGLGGGKKKGSDEFLIEKKAPLVLPPSFGELPEPGTKKAENTTSTEESNLSIEDLLNQGSSTEISKKKDDSNNSIEKSIIEKINNKVMKENLERPAEEIIKKTKKKSLFKRLKEKFN